MKQATIGIISLGCPRNLVDSQNLLGSFQAKGYKIVDIQKADIGLVNTCSFIEDAKKESIDAILDLVALKKEGRLKKIIVAGCLSQRYKEALLPQLKEVDAFIGTRGLGNEADKSYNLIPRHIAYLKISEGCNHPCTFCVIPKIKGKLQSRAMEALLEEAQGLEAKGISELNIIGQDISHYGLDIYKKARLSLLLRGMCASLKKIHWIRLLYLHPNHVTDGLIDVIANEEKICKYVDVPLQHISSRVLKAMKRQTTTKRILHFLSRLRKKIPGVALRTSLIVGFPGETEKEFKQLLSFVKEQKFERLGVFKYSREEGTPAYEYAGQIPQRLKAERFKALMQLQQRISLEFNRKLIGREFEVLIDGKSSGARYCGRLAIDAPEVDGAVYVSADRELKPGEFVRVKITDAYEYDVAGRHIPLTQEQKKSA